MDHVTTFHRTALACAVALFAALPAAATDPAAPKASYQKERADCETGRTAQDRATCLKEAGAALAEKKKGKLDNAGSPMQNTTDRCKLLPAKDQADCLARVVGPLTGNQSVTTSGSVAGGGVIKETTTTIPGAVIVVTPAPASAPK